jgi:hypothetical protein
LCSTLPTDVKKVNGRKVRELTIQGRLVKCGPYLPIPVNTSWDARCLLWSFYVKLPIRGATLEKQREYLVQKLVDLRRQIMKVEPRRNYRPHAINITYTIQDNKMKRFMIGASIGLTPAKPPILTRSMLSEAQLKVAESRVKNMKIFKRVNTVLIEQELKKCTWPWSNCSESVPWEALQGLNGHHVNLYSRSFKLGKMRFVNPCIKCQFVANQMNLVGVATVHQW